MTKHKWCINVFDYSAHDLEFCELVNEKLGKTYLTTGSNRVTRAISNPRWNEFIDYVNKTPVGYTIYKWLLFTPYNIEHGWEDELL
jgi:hypothetical protein